MSSPVLNRLIFVFSLIGLFVAGYLWYMHATPQDIPCGPSHGCETVANSRYSRFPFGSGPPVAAWGTLGYLGIAALAFLRTLPNLASRDRLLLGLIVAAAAFGSAASLGLTWLEINVIKAICKWCVASQTIILLLLGLATADLLRSRGGHTPEEL